MRKKRHVPYHQNHKVVIISVLGLLLASFVFLQLKGGMTGYAVYGVNKIEIGEIMRGGDILSVEAVDSEKLPLSSVEVSGQVIGDGAVNVFLKKGDDWLLVFSNRDEWIRPRFLIVGNSLKSKLIKAGMSYGERLFVMNIKGTRDYEIGEESSLWEVPSTCWESCWIDDMRGNGLEFYFEIEEGSAFFLDKISLR